MSTQIIDALSEELGAPPMGRDEINAFLDDGADKVSALLFTGDPAKKPEALDLVVVLREIWRGNKERLRLGVVARPDDTAVMNDYGVHVLPSVAFFAGDKHLETIPKIQNWELYEKKMSDIFSRANGDSAIEGEASNA